MTEKDDQHRHDDGVVVHLGFIEPVDDESSDNDSSHKHDCWIGHQSPQYNLWDGGQIGGRPSFLDPQNLPYQPVTCRLCGDIMKFVLQIYAPIDDYEDRAFHRSLYVFCCPNNNHNNHHSCNTNTNNNDTTSTCVGTIRVLRVQLPQENPYFPYEESSSVAATRGWDAHLPSTYNIQLCRVCGLRAPFKCPLQGCYFCSKQHQKEYKKCVFDVTQRQQCSNNTNEKKATMELEQENAGVENDHTTSLKVATATASSTGNHVLNSLPSVLPFAALVIGEEEQVDDDDDSGNDNKEKTRETMFDYNSDDEEEELDRNLEQDDLNRMTGRKTTVEIQHDVTAHFQRKCQANPWQVLRYARAWASTTASNELTDNDNGNNSQNHPLWIRADYQPKDIPPCPYCNAPRKFEFQLMPQLLHGLERLQKQQSIHQQEAALENTAADASLKSSAIAGADSCGNDAQKNGQKPGSAASLPETTDAAARYRQIKKAVQQAEDLIQQAPPEQIPPSLVEMKEAAVERLRQERFGLGGLNKKNHVGGSGGGGATIDWGVVAIYTCTKSCNGGEPADGVVVLDPVLGTYREEFAWRQPSLDAP